MLIRSEITGKSKIRYFLYEQYGRKPEIFVAYFDSLEDAGLVKRYLSGAVMRSGDQERAIKLMRNYDTAKHQQSPPV